MAVCFTYTHLVLNAVLGAKDLAEGVSTERIPQSGLGQKTRGISCIVDELDRGNRIPDPELDDGIDVDCHTVLCENLHTHVHTHTQEIKGYSK